MTCPGPQLNYSLRTESEAPGVLDSRASFPASGRALRPTAQQRAMSRSPQLPSSPPPSDSLESRAHKPSLYWRFRATKPALFNTDFSYLGWRINSTIIKSIKYTKLDFFRDASKHKLVIKRFSERLEIVFAVLKFP